MQRGGWTTVFHGWDPEGASLMMAVYMVVFWGGLIALVVLALRAVDRGRGEADRRATLGGVEILEQRFARGEIDEEEFERRKNALKHVGAIVTTPPVPTPTTGT